MEKYPAILFQTTFDSFFKRVWQLYAANFLFKIFFFVVPFFFIREVNGIVVLWLVVTLGSLLSEFYWCYKWSVNKVKSISLIDSTFVIVVTRKNTDSNYKIPVADLNTKLK